MKKYSLSMIFGILEQRFDVKSPHRYVREHWLAYVRERWLAWFPLLPAYAAYNHRLGVLVPLFCPGCWRSASACCRGHTPCPKCKGCCPSKNLWYHGLKPHAIGDNGVAKGLGCLPRLAACGFLCAAEHDVRSIRRQIMTLKNCDVYGDRAYLYHDLHEECAQRHMSPLPRCPPPKACLFML